MCPVFVLRAVQIAVFCSCAAMGTRFGIAALGTAISREGVIAPSGIAIAFQFCAAAIALGVVAVHIAVFISIYGFRAAVLTVAAGRTLAV